METLILDGKKVANELFSKLPNGNGKELAIITIGDDDASKVYVRNKIKDAERVGFKGINYRFKNDENTYLDITNLIMDLNHKDSTAGIMIQRPYSKELEGMEEYINTYLDIDGLNGKNLYRTLSGKSPIHYPATPKGIIKLLEYYNIPIEGKNVCIIGRSDIVGKPLAAMMTARNATVTLCHSKTPEYELYKYLINADIIVSAVGKSKFLKAKHILHPDDSNDGSNCKYPVIIDVGMNRDENGKLCGDVDFDDVYPYCSAITPVPGGVGPMTRWGLIDNCFYNM